MCVVLDYKSGRVGFIKVYGGKIKAPQIKLVHSLQRDLQILLLGGEIRALFEFVYFAAHCVRARGHQLGVKAVLLAAAVEIRGIKGQGPVHLEIGYAEGHHNIRHRVSLGEKIGYLAAGLDIPVRHAQRFHLLLGVVREGAAFFHLALTHGLHGLEGQLAGHTLFHKVQHDIVPAAYALVDVGDFVYDQIVDVAVPHVRAVGKAGKAHQRVKPGGLGVHQHLAGEARAEFRYADGAGMADYGVVLRHSQHLGRGEYAHGALIVQGYFPGIDAGGVLQHFYHGGVIVTQLVQLQKVGLHAVIFKMRCDNVAVGIIRRVLHRAEIRHVLVLRHHHKAAGVLAGGALHAHKPQRQTVLLRLCHGHVPLFKVFFHIAVGGLFRQSADGSGSEHMVRAEKLLGIFVGLGLIFAGEIEVDIWGLFISREAQKGLKRYVEAVLAHFRAAVRAVFVRHIRAAAPACVGDELGVPALGADIMRRQGVDLRYAGHIGHNGRTHAASGAHKIAVLQ